MIEHGQRVCKLTFEHMLEEPTVLYGEAIGSSYQRQHETLGKYFLRPSGPGTSETTSSTRRRDTEDSDQLALPIERG
jgi:2'-deoxycytidine 5'-triphosphate deaminase (DCD)